MWKIVICPVREITSFDCGALMPSGLGTYEQPHRGSICMGRGRAVGRSLWKHFEVEVVEVGGRRSWSGEGGVFFKNGVSMTNPVVTINTIPEKKRWRKPRYR